MNRKKRTYICMFPALAAGFAAMMYLILAKGRTDNGVFLYGGGIFAITAGVLYLIFGREKNTPQQKTGAEIAGEEFSARESLQARTLEALKNYDSSAINEIEDPEILYKVATIDISSECMSHQFYTDPYKGKDRFGADWENEWANESVRVGTMRKNIEIAIDRLDDAELLDKIARKEGLFSEYAAEKLFRLHAETASVLARDETVMPAVREAAVRALMDQTELEELYQKNENEKLRLQIIGQLTDQPFLENIADNSESKELRKAAAFKVSDPKRREKYCKEYGTHDWIYEREERSENGDDLDIWDVYRCRYCGEMMMELDKSIRM
ncbi:MAG: hypothetical protein IJI45_15845 [Anaerolineaceae bacterium]|nr:hypothetical protein [Oscillospiraceae bacterium]MBQ4454499.1 hypothetical protein [Clostridia bacterium]MBQ6482581.1 hypothetical protein [Anaerolineaceae bacterium]